MLDQAFECFLNKGIEILPHHIRSMRLELATAARPEHRFGAPEDGAREEAANGSLEDNSRSVPHSGARDGHEASRRPDPVMTALAAHDLS